MKRLVAFLLLSGIAAGAQSPRKDDGLARGVATADSLVAAAIEHMIPGAVLVVAQNGKLLHERAFGWAQLNDFERRRLAAPRPMHSSTLFDLASVTKVMATTMAVMMLASDGRIDVDAPVYRYLPDFRGVHLDSITVRHLLTHSAGLVQWQPLYYHASNERETYAVIRQMPLQWGVGEARHYSDLGFMLLGYIVERVTGRSLDRFLADSLYAPLGLHSTTYLPTKHGFTDFAATEQGNGYERHMVYDSTFGYRYRGDPTAWNGWRQYVLNGETDDGNSWYANGGVAGHAGLFSTAADLRVLLDLLLAKGTRGGRQYIRPEVVDRFLTRDRYENFLGWMSPNGLPEGSFSHTGFTGTYVLGVPKYGLSIVLLTNRQNIGTDARGYFPDVGPLDAAVARAIVAGAEADQAPRQRTYTNPIDIDYRYNFEQHNEGISYRSGADPVIVVHRGVYYLFETIGDGYWESHDLGTWRHITPTRWPITDVVAPAALSVRDTIYLLPSTTRPLPILMLTEPATGRVEFYNRLLPWLPMARDNEARTLAKPDSVQPGPWDPAFFHDSSTERWFLYWNSSNAYPLHVIELDKTRQLAYKGTPRWLFGLDPVKHGWERFGRDHRDTAIAPFIEGAWMTQRGGKYYLQYGAPGTEYNVYATGTYVADDPLGPFTYAPYNPVAYKPGGFVQGAGHGNTFQDVYGNWWNTGTPWIAVNWNFERRIGLHPAGFDADGQLYVDTRFGDFPRWLPTQRSTSAELFTGWMLLSYRKPASASSARDSFPASAVTDENPRTFWVAGQNRPGEWLTVDLGRQYTVKAIQVNYADYKSGLYGTDSTVSTQFRLAVSNDGRAWRRVADLSRERRDRPNAYVELAVPLRARFVRYEHLHVGAANLAISDIRVFGNGDGPRPATPRGLTARRDRDERDVLISWEPLAGAVGYNVRWGIAPAKLYETYQRFADEGPTLDLRALTVGQSYWVAIESFDENGVSALSAPVPIR